MSITLGSLATIMPALLDTGVSIELISSPGIGKSEFVEALPHVMQARAGFNDDGTPKERWGFATAFLATYTPPDMVGYQFKGERMWRDPATGKMAPVAVTEPTLPLWMISTEGKPLYEYDRGILFLDEYGQGEADVKRASAQLLLKGEVGPWKLPPGWSVIAASNRLSDRSGVTKSLDFVINRRLQYEIQPDLEAWDAWAQRAGIHPLFTAFAAQHPEIVFADKVPDQQGPWCTPRSFVMAERLLRRISGDDERLRMDSIALVTLAGMVGDGAASQIKAYVDLGLQMPPYSEVVAKPDTCKVPDAADGMMLACYELAARAKPEDFGALLTYMQRIGQEFQVMFIKRLVNRDASWVTHKDLFPLISKNAALINVMQGR